MFEWKDYSIPKKSAQFGCVSRNLAILCLQLCARLKCCSPSKCRFVLTTLSLWGLLPLKAAVPAELFAEWFPDDNRVQFPLK